MPHLFPGEYAFNTPSVEVNLCLEQLMSEIYEHVMRSSTGMH